MGQCLESAQPNTQWETGEGKAGAQSNKVSKIFVAVDHVVAYMARGRTMVEYMEEREDDTESRSGSLGSWGRGRIRGGVEEEEDLDHPARPRQRFQHRTAISHPHHNIKYHVPDSHHDE